jgi:hypothetical protein
MLEPVLLLPLDVGVDAIEHVPDTEEVHHLSIVEQLPLQRLRQTFSIGLMLAGHQDQCCLLVVFLGPPLRLDEARLPLVIAEQYPVADRGLAVSEGFPDDAAAADLEVIDDHEAAG